MPMMLRCMFPAAEADNPLLDAIDKMVDGDSGVHVAAMDWVRYGQLLRHELGWGDTYPVCPPSDEVGVAVVDRALRMASRFVAEMRGRMS